jgi:hypothetical protein
VPERTGSAKWIVRLASWLVVGIPAAWGVAEVVRKSVALFK